MQPSVIVLEIFSTRKHLSAEDSSNKLQNSPEKRDTTASYKYDYLYLINIIGGNKNPLQK